MGRHASFQRICLCDAHGGSSGCNNLPCGALLWEIGKGLFTARSLPVRGLSSSAECLLLVAAVLWEGYSLMKNWFQKLGVLRGMWAALSCTLPILLWGFTTSFTLLTAQSFPVLLETFGPDDA